MFFFWVNK